MAEWLRDVALAVLAAGTGAGAAVWRARAQNRVDTATATKTEVEATTIATGSAVDQSLKTLASAIELTEQWRSTATELRVRLHDVETRLHVVEQHVRVLEETIRDLGGTPPPRPQIRIPGIDPD